MIREHVQAVTSYPQDQDKYCNPQTAYTTWMSETAWFFGIQNDETQNMDPLIIIDTCELLAEHEHHWRQHASIDGRKTPYTLLEEFCRAMPSPQGRGLFIGCNAKFDVDFSMTLANVQNLGPLLPLTFGGFRDAVEKSWESRVDENLLIPLHDVCGGQPRFLRLALEPRPISLGSADAFSQWFEALKETVKPELPSGEDKWFPYAYTCLLASSTKAQVAGSDVIPVNPTWANDAVKLRTYDEAMIYSIGTQDAITQRFTVPPITFVDAVATKPGTPIPPSELHPFLKPKVVKLFRHANALERGRQFEKPFMYAVYARYLLEYWKDTSKPWISLAKVFEGAVQTEQQSVMERYEVNLSDGMKTGDGQEYENAVANAVTYMGASAHHDAYIWCRQKSTAKGVKVAPFPIPLQIRFGKPKTVKELMVQLRRSKATEEPVQLLLSVNQEECEVRQSHCNQIVMINASAMSTISWLRWI